MNSTIDKAIQEKIVDIISALIPNAKIYLFGSRARGTHSKWSDIDLALDTGKPLTNTNIDEVKSVLAATNIPYKVDVLDFQTVSTEMQVSIKRDGILWKN
jgi:predicted nucleotidyltransferase